MERQKVEIKKQTESLKMKLASMKESVAEEQNKRALDLVKVKKQIKELQKTKRLSLTMRDKLKEELKALDKEIDSLNTEKEERIVRKNELEEL